MITDRCDIRQCSSPAVGRRGCPWDITSVPSRVASRAVADALTTRMPPNRYLALRTSQATEGGCQPLAVFRIFNVPAERRLQTEGLIVESVPDEYTDQHRQCIPNTI